MTADDVLSAFDALPRAEQRALLAWFAGGNVNVIKWGDHDKVSFGKYECEQVDFGEVWLGKFVDLGWLTVRETRRFMAHGMVGQPESVEYELKATAKGSAVREAWHARTRGSRVAHREPQRAFWWHARTRGSRLTVLARDSAGNVARAHVRLPITASVDVACPTCRGAGGREASASSTSYFWKECPDCGGTGRSPAVNAIP